MSGAPTRRSVLTGGLVVAAGTVVGYVVTRRSDAVRASAAAGANGYGPAGGDGRKGGADGVTGSGVARLTDLPDGGGVVLADQHVVLVRAGDQVHGLSATCTHQGCTVEPPAGGRLACPCHGSVFDAATGDVVTGPATSPLAPVRVEVRGGTVYLAGGG